MLIKVKRGWEMRESEATPEAVFQNRRALQTKADPGGKAILTPEQIKTIDEFRTEMLNTRQQLRQVQRALREDIDTLDARLKFLNIGLIPILVALVAIVLGVTRRRRRSRRYGVHG